MWVLVAGLIAGYVYLVRVVGPEAVGRGVPAVSRRNLVAFVAAMALLWFAADWPLHDLAEQYLYSAHMVQHMVLSYFVPPLALLATPEWLLRVLIGDGRVYRAVRWFARPVVAGVLFNGVVMITHVPALVNASGENGIVHYSLHVLIVVSSLLMWIPVCGPLPEARISAAGTMIYLFAQSFVPTVPAGWLTFAGGVVYGHYDHAVRVWGIGVTADQQLAGAIMKIGGSVFLWAIVVYLFFGRFMKNWEQQNAFRRVRMPDAEVTGHDEEVLTFDAVAKSFSQSTAPSEPR
ncbi:MAG: cytochrome c oxidase assembly protein [Acidimicrobiales bacterium]